MLLSRAAVSGQSGRNCSKCPQWDSPKCRVNTLLTLTCQTLPSRQSQARQCQIPQQRGYAPGGCLRTLGRQASDCLQFVARGQRLCRHNTARAISRLSGIYLEGIRMRRYCFKASAGSLRRLSESKADSRRRPTCKRYHCLHDGSGQSLVYPAYDNSKQMISH